MLLQAPLLGAFRAFSRLCVSAVKILLLFRPDVVYLLLFANFVFAMLEKTHLRRFPVSEESFTVNIFFRHEPPIARVGRVVPVVAHDEVMMIVHPSRRKTGKRLVMFD